MTLKELADELKKKYQEIQQSVVQKAAQVASNPKLNQAAQTVQDVKQAVSPYVGFNKPTFPVGPRVTSQGIQPIHSNSKPLNYASDRLTNYIKNTYVSSVKDLPTAANQAFNWLKPAEPINVAGYQVTNPVALRSLNTARFGLDVLGAIPDPSDFVLGVYNAGKGGVKAYQEGQGLKQGLDTALKTATMENYVGLGDIAVKGDPGGQLAMNVLELPLTIAALSATSRNLDDNLRMVSRAVKAGEITAEEGEVIVSEMRRLQKMARKVPEPKVEKSSKRVVGAPPGINSPEKLIKLRSSLIQDTLAGSPGKNWYKASGEAILDMFGGNKKEANKFAQLLAIYSPSTTVDANFTNAMKAWYQYSNGQPIKAGRFGWMDNAASNLLYKGMDWDGRKTNSFYNNIVKTFNKSADTDAVTVDMWMMRGMGYNTDSPSPQQYEFIKNEITRVANQLGWDPEQVQAAYWINTVVKNDPKINMDNVNAQGFADAARKTYGQLSWEAAPSKKSNLFPELHNAPIEQRIEYHAAMDKIFYDENGNDLVAEMLGLPVAESKNLPGAFEGQVNPGTQFIIPMPKGHKMQIGLEPATKTLLDKYAAIRGKYSVQDAVAYHKPFYNGTIAGSNGVEISVGRQLSFDEIAKLDKKVIELAKTADLSPVSTPDGVRFLNFTNLDNKSFHDIIRKAIVEVLPDDAEVRLFTSDGNFISNDWVKNKYGQDYNSVIAEGSPDLLGRSDSLFANKAEGVIDEFSKKYGWSDGRKAKLTENETGAEKLIRSGRDVQIGLTTKEITPEQRMSNLADVNYRQQVLPGTETGPQSFQGQPKVDTRAIEKTSKQEFEQWQKAFNEQNKTRTSNQVINDLTKQMKTETDFGAAGIGNADSWKDKARLLLSRETMERNFTDVMGKEAPEMINKYIDPVYETVAKETRWKNRERADIRALDIQPGTRESAILQHFGEGDLTADQVRKMTPDADKIFKAEKVIRNKYDKYLEEINKTLTRNGYDPIPKRKDYFRHFQDMGEMFDRFGIPSKAENLPTDINGLTADFKPGKNFFSSSLQRKGGEYTADAIRGIDQYIDGAAPQIYRTDDIKRLRELEKQLRIKYAGSEHLSNFVADLGEYINLLAGKKGMIDRSIESSFGRGIYKYANTLKRQVGSNMVGMNVSSSLTNYIPLTQSLATTGKKNFIQAMFDTMGNVFKNDGFIDRSDFLTSRIGSDKLYLTKWEKMQNKGGWLFSAIDGFTSQVVTRSKYLDNIAKGMDEAAALKEANRWARKLMAGRSAGEMPTLFGSRTLGLLTQFQLEVNNQISFMFKDIPRAFNKKGAASALGQLFIYSYIFNNFFEQATGRRPAFDPIGVVLQAYQDYTNENMRKGQATKNTVENVAGQLPFASTFTGGRIPLGAAIPNPIAALTGESTWSKELSKPLFYLAPSTGGGQIKKTIEGVNAYSKGASTSPSGRVRFPIPQTPGNMIRTGLFGQWSTPEGQTYLREGRGVLGEKQTEKFFNAPNPEDYYNQVIETRQRNNASKKEEQEPGILEKLFGPRNEAEASTEQELPKIDNDFQMMYEDAQKTISGYQDLASKIRLGKSDTTLEEAQTELVDAKNLLKRMEAEQPERVYKIGLEIYKSGGGKNVEERAAWAAEWLNKAKDEKEYESWYQGMLDSGVMTESVAEALQEMGLKVDRYTSGGKIKYLGGSGSGKTIKFKAARTKYIAPTIKTSSRRSSSMPTIKFAAPPKQKTVPFRKYTIEA